MESAAFILKKTGCKNCRFYTLYYALFFRFVSIRRLFGVILFKIFFLNVIEFLLALLIQRAEQNALAGF